MLSACAAPVLAQGAFDDALAFDPATFETLSVTVDGTPLEMRRYEVVYAGQPIEMAPVQPFRTMGPGGGGGDTTPLEDPLAMQTMIVYVPEAAAAASTIILHVNNGGWFASPVSDRVEAGGEYSATSDDDPIGRALAEGYVIVSAGTRGRSALAADDTHQGKAPAAVVDVKAAIRYLRLNDGAMPGSAERIVITGTSGGGALSAAVAASGNSPDFYPFLAEIGAAGIAADGTSTLDDDVFATIAYCPITDLGHADAAYEWQFDGVRTAGNTGQNNYAPAAQEAHGVLAAAYPPYLESLGLTLEDGTPLTADTMDDAILAAVRRETEEAIAAGIAIPAIGEDFALTIRDETVTLPNDWLDVQDGAVVGIDYDAYLRFVAAASPLKIVPAFDATANTDHEGLRGESSLFGGPDVPYANFTAYGWDGNQVPGDGSGPDDTGLDWAAYVAGGEAVIDDQLRLIDPFAFLGTDADAAPYWYLRHGMIDRDTSFAVEVALAHAVMADPDVEEVSFELAWLRGHEGNYDVQEAYAWLAERLAQAGDATAE